MPRLAAPRFQGLMILAGAAGLLVAAGTLSGCPGSLDPSLLPPPTGSGGSSGSGGGNGTGGTMTVDCSGSNSGATIITSQCGICHSASSAGLLGAGLDLTVDSNIGSRLVGVTSPGATGSMCGGNSEPYLEAGSNPAKGLLILKIQDANCQNDAPCCGGLMPSGNLTPLPTTQQQCIIQWATTLTTQ